MKGKLLIRIAVLSALMTSLTGCNGGLKLVEDDPFNFISNYRDVRVNNGYDCEQFTEYTRTADDGTVQRKYVVDNVKALVVPVDFTDYPSTIYGSEEYTLGMLNKAVFSDEGSNGWYSLRSYYKSSSFGTCNVTGVVAPWWHTGDAVADIPRENAGYATQIATNIQNYYTEHPELINLNDYDANNDGFIDSLIMIYSAPINPIEAGDSGLWWAFCWNIAGSKPVEGKKVVHRYFWASMQFLFEKGNNKYYTNEEIASGSIEPDVHTLTHEYGHVLSLPDYYITDYSTTDYSGLGALDMMDYNIGDHNTYSKMCYGWVTPKRVEGKSGSLKVTLNSTTDTGDAILISAPGEWGNTYMDQYLLVEFLTPTGVAKKDGEEKYLGSYPKYYSKAGIRILHVDSRLGLFTSAGFSGYTLATKSSNKNAYVSVAADNTASRSCFPDYKIIEIMPASGKTQKQRKRDADDKCLYYEGDSFGTKEVFADFKLNGTKGKKDKDFGFKIYINKIDGIKSATITIKR